MHCKTTLNSLDYSVIQFGTSYKNLSTRGDVNHVHCTYLHKLEKAIRQNQNEINDQTTKKTIFQWKRCQAESWNKMRDLFSTSSIKSIIVKGVDSLSK